MYAQLFLSFEQNFLDKNLGFWTTKFNIVLELSDRQVDKKIFGAP